jgi:CheY-like chemotaxis protein
VNKPIRQDILRKHVISKLRQHDHTTATEEQANGNKLSANFSQQYPLRILIAEDNRVNQKLAMRVLGKLGYNPDIAQDGNEVLEMVNDSKYDLILMDVQMPEMDGLEATRMIRLCLTVQPIIIAMTANSMQGDREDCMRAGMDDYISKPVHLEELVIMLEKWALAVKEKR